jgi:hypothetical protein
MKEHKHNTVIWVVTQTIGILVGLVLFLGIRVRQVVVFHRRWEAGPSERQPCCGNLCKVYLHRPIVHGERVPLR